MSQSSPARVRDVGSVGSVSKTRVEALSDGVFAIIVTLLVLELGTPHLEAAQSTPALAGALLALAPKFVSWVISFAIVCVVWLNHHRLLDQFARITVGLFWMNALLLLSVSFIPFPTALLGDYPSNALAVSFFGVALALMGLAFAALRVYALKRADLFRDDVNRERFIAGTRRTVIFGPLLYLAGALVAWVWPPLAFAIYAFIPIYFIWPREAR